MKKYILFVLAFVLLLAGCKECPECTCPDCVCPESQTTTVTKFVCPDGSVVSSSSECILEEVEEETEEVYTEPSVDLVKTNEEGTLIQEVTVKPSCVSGEDGIYIYYTRGGELETTTYQIKEFGQEYQDVMAVSNIKEATRYFAICSGKCYSGNYQLEPGKIYVFRLKFELEDGTEYSNEHLIDARQGSRYIGRGCSS